VADAETVQLADALVASLQTVTFDPAVAPVRMYLPKHDLADLANVQVTIVPRGPVETMASRGSYQQDLAIEVGLQKKIDPAHENAECDTYMGLMKELTRHCRFRALLSGYTWIANEAVSPDTLWLPNHLRELSVFTAVLRVTHRGIKRHS